MSGRGTITSRTIVSPNVMIDSMSARSSSSITPSSTPISATASSSSSDDTNGPCLSPFPGSTTLARPISARAAHRSGATAASARTGRATASAARSGSSTANVFGAVSASTNTTATSRAIATPTPTGPRMSLARRRPAWRGRAGARCAEHERGDGLLGPPDHVGQHVAVWRPSAASPRPRALIRASAASAAASTPPGPATRWPPAPRARTRSSPEQRAAPVTAVVEPVEQWLAGHRMTAVSSGSAWSWPRTCKTPYDEQRHLVVVAAGVGQRLALRHRRAHHHVAEQERRSPGSGSSRSGPACRSGHRGDHRVVDGERQHVGGPVGVHEAGRSARRWTSSSTNRSDSSASPLAPRPPARRAAETQRSTSTGAAPCSSAPNTWTSSGPLRRGRGAGRMSASSLGCDAPGGGASGGRSRAHLPPPATSLA